MDIAPVSTVTAPRSAAPSRNAATPAPAAPSGPVDQTHLSPDAHAAAGAGADRLVQGLEDHFGGLVGPASDLLKSTGVNALGEQVQALNGGLQLKGAYNLLKKGNVSEALTGAGAGVANLIGGAGNKAAGPWAARLSGVQNLIHGGKALFQGTGSDAWRGAGEMCGGVAKLAAAPVKGPGGSVLQAAAGAVTWLNTSEKGEQIQDRQAERVYNLKPSDWIQMATPITNIPRLAQVLNPF